MTPIQNQNAGADLAVPLDLSKQQNPVVSVSFERGQYERFLKGLIEVEQRTLQQAP